MMVLQAADKQLDQILLVASGRYHTMIEYERALNRILIAAEGGKQALALARTEISQIGYNLRLLRERPKKQAEVLCQLR